MIARNGFAELGLPKEGLRAAPIVSETYWGCVIRPAEPLLERAALIEIAAPRFRDRLRDDWRAMQRNRLTSQ